MTSVAEVLDGFFVQSETPILFAGAGVSARCGLPNWTGYLGHLAGAINEYDQFTKYQMDRQISEWRLDVAASYYFLCPEIPKATQLRELVVPLEEYDAAKIRDLVALPFTSVTTTNFDDALADAYAAQWGRNARAVNSDDPTLDGALFETKFYIARIHGRVDVPQTMRLSKEHFDQLLQNTSYSNFLAHIFTQRNVLFVGFSFLDPAIKSVLRSVKATFKNLHGRQHLALIPRNATGEFLAELESHDIKRHVYSDADGHAELWEGISIFKNGAYDSSKFPNAADLLEKPFRTTKKYLATAYARMKVGRAKEGPLSRAITEGMVSGMVAQSGATGITEAELVDQIGIELSLDDDAAHTLVGQGLDALIKDGLCESKMDGEVTRFLFKTEPDSFYAKALDRLVDGAAHRYAVRERATDSVYIRSFLTDVFSNLVLHRGWDLGAAFAAHRMPEDTDVSLIIRGIRDRPRELTESVTKKLTATIEDLLARPDDEEAKILSELGRLSFGLELLVQSPRDALFYQRTLPERIYLDANVLMPAITTGHPQKLVLTSAIKLLQKNASSALLKTSLCVYKGFLNEIVSHRQIAIDSMRQHKGEGAIWAEREVSIFGSGNVNVYIGAYFNLKTSAKDLGFDEFLKKYAPYRTEAELEKYLANLGYIVVGESVFDRKDLPDILHALESYYANKLEKKRKSATVIAHDAVQLSLLSYEMSVQRRSMFVSADKSLRGALEAGGFAWLANVMMTPLALTQIVDLLFGGTDRSRSMTSLLWMSNVSSNTERVRDHLINLALRHHDAALAMNLGDIVNAIAEDVGAELDAKELDLENDASAYSEDRAQVHGILDRYESDFFKKMRTEIERRSQSKDGR